VHTDHLQARTMSRWPIVPSLFVLIASKHNIMVESILLQNLGRAGIPAP